MHRSDISLMTGEKYEKPVIHWEEEDKYAIIAFLLLSIDKKVDHNGMVRFDDLFGLNDTPPEMEEGEEYSDAKSKREARDTIVKECETFLDKLDSDERYDAVVEEIDRFIQGDHSHSKCNIGGCYQTFGVIPARKLDGGAHRIWWLIQLVISDADYAGNKRRVLKNLARKWDVDSAVLPILERSAKLLPEIIKKRQELSESGLPHNEVVKKLARLDTEEKELWKQLKKYGIAETLKASEFAASHFRRINALRALNGQEPVKPDINELEAAPDDDEYKEPGIGDKICGAIEEGIMKVTDIICAPFEWMTDKLMGL